MKFNINVELNYTEGKFASKEELADKVKEAITDADPGTIEGDNGGQYDVVTWEVIEQ